MTGQSRCFARGRSLTRSRKDTKALPLIEEREAEREARLEALRSEIARGRESGAGVPEHPLRRLAFSVEAEADLRSCTPRSSTRDALETVRGPMPKAPR